MPIVRTYQCAACFHRIEVMLDASQWDSPPPECPACAQREMHQEFKPVAIGGSVRSKAVALAEDIAGTDYNVADMQHDKNASAPKVRYKDQTSTIPQSTWTAATETLEAAIASGRQTRLRYGSGLDVLQANLKSGAQPDLIAESKKKLIRVW